MVEFKPLEKKHVEFKPLNYTPAKETELYDFSKVDGTYYRSENGINVQPTNKIDFVLSALNMIPNKPKPVQDVLDNANYINKTVKNTDFSKLASQGVKSFARQTLSLFSGATGSMMRIYGDMNYADAENYKGSLDDNFVKANNLVFGSIRDLGKAIEDASDRLQQSDFLKADEELFKGDIYDNPNLHKYLDLAMSGSASLVGTYGIARISNPAVALWAMSGVDAKDIYFGAREAGESKEKSAALFAAGTAGTAKLEQIGLEKVFNIKFNKTNIEPIIKGTKDTVKKIAQAIVAEGGEEGVQTVYQNAVKKYGYDDTQDLYEGAVESMIGGALGGGLVASVNFGIERFRGIADRLGVSEEEQNQFLETTAQAIADNPDLIDIPFQENMKKTYNSFTQMINELGDSPEAERLKQTKLDLDEGYNKYYEQFKTYMPEVQAKANADLIRSSALFFSDLEGMSVKDWFEKKAPQVIKTNDIMQQVRDFQSRVNPVKYRVDEKDINLFEALKYPKILKQYERKGKNLIQFIRKRGGIKDVGGELKNMDIGKQFIGVINNKSGVDLDDMTLAAWENGYLPDSDFNYGRPEIQTLLDAIRDESFGTHHYGEDTERTVYDDVEDLREQLDRMGIDWQSMSPAEIEQAYNDYNREYEEDEREAERWAIMNEGSVSENPFELDDIPFQDIAEENARLDDIYPEYTGETINVNGVEKTVYNSNGDRIAKSKEALENFYRWFGNSKVVDEQGRPLVVYHGTNKKFDTFDKGKIGKKHKNLYQGKGFYFTSEYYDAQNYGRRIMPVYLKIENPALSDYNLKSENDGISAAHGVWVAFNPNQIKSTQNRGTYSESENIYYQDGDENIYGATNSNEEPIANPANFNIFIEGSKVTDNDDPVSPENPPKRIYRGDTRYFEEYEAQENAYEYDWGEGFYLSDDYEDVAENYQSRGADLTNRIDREAEQLAKDEDIDYDEAREKVRKQYEQEDIIREFYLSIKEPVIIGGEKETFFDYTEEYNEETDEYGEPQGKLLDLIYGIENYLADIGADDYTQAITGNLYEQAIENGGLTASQVEDIVRGTEEANYLIDYESGPGEMLSSVFVSIGFDGIIDHRAGTKFKNMNMNPDTTHYIVFNSEQAKSVDNKGQWGVTNKNFYYQTTWHGGRELEGGKFSLKYAGQQTGAMHGYGIYTALSPDTAATYRSMIDQNFTYKGEHIADFMRSLERAEEYDKYSIVEDFAMKQTKETMNKEDYSDDTWNWFEKEFLPNVKSEGKLYEVETPDDFELIDEQKRLSEQPENVRFAILAAIEKIDGYGLTAKAIDRDAFGGDLYIELGKDVFFDKHGYEGGSTEIMKAASEFLDKIGIKGIKYDGGEEGTNFVIFNPENVKILQKFYQGEQAPRGAYVNRIIYLNENANASTLPHELAHFWSDELRNSKSLRAKEILRTADKWENQEFERKYNVVEQDGKYIVTDKTGKTVYDKQGEGFDSEVRARAYAKEELFARGFEKYLKEGKAPNKTLRTAFRNFYNWLKKIYSDMMSLDIKLNKPMRNLYADILGGTSIDTFLDSDIDEFVQQRAEAEQDRLTEVNKIISQAQGTSITLPERIRKAYEDFDFGETWKKIAVPLSTRAKRVSPTLRNKLRRYEYDSLMVKQNYYKEIEPMLKKWREFSKEDSIAFDLALKNEVAEIRDEILAKYDAEEDFNKVREVLEDIYYKANDAGLEVGYIEDYFPRKVKDKDGLLSYLHGTDEWSGYQQALQREDPYNEFTAEEQADFLDKFLRGIVRADVASYKYSSEKARKLDTIDNTLNQYYADSMQALISYIDGMNARIQTVNFFGRNRENVEESIGEFIAYQLNNNLIKPNQVDEVKSILTAVFSRMGLNSQWIKGLRDVGYLYTMGGVNTAITQIDDIFVAAYKGGIFNTIQAVLSKDKITKKDLGLNSIAAEFIEGTGTSKAVNWVFKKNGIELIDGFGKNALLNGVLIKMQKMSDADLRAYLEPIMEDETEQTLQDVRNGELSDNVRFFLFNELSDMQPVSLSELPELYNTGGNMRIFYMLKSFMLKRIDTIRNECYDKIKTGNKSEQQEGLRNLYRLVLLMMIGGASKDLLIDLMYQRVIDLNDMLVNNLLGIIGISKYNIYQVREEGLGHSLAIFAMPPLFQVAEDLSGDVNKYLDGKRELKDFEVFKGLPIVGRFYYWLIGGGKTKTEKKRGKSNY